jgi:alkanesulfonate monooxygenase SsuD/methylene tetrahydromethanopterin reductase-like flavin-dependent oxidoreductase (luciferase family)
VSCGLRDVLSFEALGKPAVLVASAAFETAAVRQAAALGQPEVRRVLVAHPIADRTDEEMHELARHALEAILTAMA